MPATMSKSYFVIVVKPSVAKSATREQRVNYAVNLRAMSKTRHFKTEAAAERSLGRMLKMGLPDVFMVSEQMDF